jgi:NTP pyrophosphatase (non-canonical NTP hydrolase)
MSDTDRLQRLLEIMARLRDPERGCPWDRAQDFASIAPYTIEEAYEVAEAIAENDMAALKDELGDLLFQVVFHARMAEEQGAFVFADAVAAISDKMLRRHPHVFGDAAIADAAAQTAAWEAHKAQEREAKSDDPQSALDGVGIALPALTRAEKIQKRAARVGFDWPGADPRQDRGGDRRAPRRARRWPQGGNRGRARRSPLRRRQSRPPSRDRPGDCLAQRDAKIRAPLPPRRGAARRERPHAGGVDARRDGGAVAAG